MPHQLAIARMKELLRPGGRLIVHDLRASSGLVDEARSWVLEALESAKRFLRTGWPLSPPAVRHAWARHEAGERYLTIDEATDLAARLLPGARVLRHAWWRYTIVWDKAAENQVRQESLPSAVNDLSNCWTSVVLSVAGYSLPIRWKATPA